jgi:hypothetical protein
MSKARRSRARRAIARRQTATPRIRDAFDALVRLLVDLSAALADLNAMPPAEGSPAAADETWAAPGPLLHPTPALEASQFPRTLIAHAGDHLQGLGALLSAGGGVLAPFSLLRPALESASTAYYLLAPEIDTVERIRRWANVRLRSLVEQERLVLAPDDVHLRERVQQLTARLIDDAQAFGFDAPGKAHTDKGWPLERSFGEPVPRSQNLIAALLQSVGPEAGPFYHRTLSAMIHGQPHGMEWFISAVEDAEWSPVPSNQQQFTRTVATTAAWLSPLVTGLGELVDRASAYYGWAPALWDEEYGYTRQSLALCVSSESPPS